MEKWDLYDRNKVSLGKVIIRGEQHQSGTYHIVVYIIIMNEQSEMLMTLRHPDKVQYPNLWENTGGSILSGEDSMDGAKREIYEEVGLCPCTKELLLIGSLIEKTAIVDIYLYKSNVKVNEFKLQDTEVAEAKWVSKDELRNMVEAGLVSDAAARRLKAASIYLSDSKYYDKL